MKRTQPKRCWAAARAKCDAEEACRVGPVGCEGRLEAAHLVGRDRDQFELDGWPRLGPWRVEPVRIVPLCTKHHDRYDGRAHPRLDLLGHLTAEEEAQAVLDAGGLELARRKLAPAAYRSVAA